MDSYADGALPSTFGWDSSVDAAITTTQFKGVKSLGVTDTQDATNTGTTAGRVRDAFAAAATKGTVKLSFYMEATPTQAFYITIFHSSSTSSANRACEVIFTQGGLVNIRATDNSTQTQISTFTLATWVDVIFSWDKALGKCKVTLGGVEIGEYDMINAVNDETNLELKFGANADMQTTFVYLDDIGYTVQ